MMINKDSHRKTAGSLYHTELARQLSDWLITRVLPAKGPAAMLQLPDMYCLFNRARGSGIPKILSSFLL